MANQITELTFLEQLSKRFKIPVPEFICKDSAVSGTVTFDRSAINKNLEKWGGEALVKPDVLSGRRGKAGVIKLVKNYREAQQEIKRISNTEIDGKLPRTVYMVRNIPARYEVYTAITYNSKHLGPSFTVSLQGGVDIEQVPEDKKTTVPVDVYKGLDAYQASEVLDKLNCPKEDVSLLSRTFVNFWDLFISTGMRMCEINPWRITPEGKPYACDFKAVFDEANFRFKNLDIIFPEYPESISLFEEEMASWNASSHQGQAYVCDLRGSLVLPVLFGGGASTIITETLSVSGGSPMFLSDFGGNPPYERMYKTAQICFKHNLKEASLLLILGGKANNTLIDVTFQAIGDALINYVEENGPVNCPVVIGRGGPRLTKGITIIKEILESLKLPYVIFGHDTPVTLVAEYAAKLAKVYYESKKSS